MSEVVQKNNEETSLIRLADGTEIPGTVGRWENTLMLTMAGDHAQTHLLDFGNPEMMKHIVFVVNAKHQTVYDGFIVFGCLELNEDKAIVFMRKKE